MPNDAQRQLSRELVVPFRPDDVIIKDVRVGELIAQPGEQVGVIDREPSNRPDRRRDLRIARFRQHRRASRGIVICVGAKTNFSFGAHLLEKIRKEETTLVVVRVVLVLRERIEIDRAEPFVAQIPKAAEAGLTAKYEAVICVGKPFEPRTTVVPVIDRENRWPMPEQARPFRSNSVLREVAEAANVRTAKESWKP